MGQKEETEEKQERNNFAKGSIVVNILKLAVPMTCLLYTSRCV